MVFVVLFVFSVYVLAFVFDVSGVGVCCFCLNMLHCFVCLIRCLYIFGIVCVVLCLC